MRKPIRRSWQTVVPFILFVMCILANGCSCDPPSLAIAANYSICEGKHAPFAIASPLKAKNTTPGKGAVDINISGTGALEATIPLVGPGSGNDELRITYDGENEGSLGFGFGINGVSVVQRCNKTMALDGEQKAIQFDDSDFTSMCLDGKCLVVVAQSKTEIEYRLFPDAQIKVVLHLDDAGNEYFEAFWPSAEITTFGKTAENRVMGPNNQVRSWLAGEKADPRGNRTTYGWCIAENEDGTAAEYALDLVQTFPVGRTEPTQSTALVYGVKDADSRRRGFSNGVATQQTLQLNEVQHHAGKALAGRFLFGHEISETSKRTRLATVEQCDAQGDCFAPTRFQYAKSELGFVDVNMKIPEALSDKASYFFADVNGDGLPEYIVPDSTPASTAELPVTEWRVARNTVGAFAAEKVALLQEWSFQQDPEGPSDPTLLQPELATAIPFRSAGKTSFLLHDVYGNRNNHVVLLPKADGAFEEHDTGLARPFPIGPTPKGLRSPFASVHLAAVTPDGVPSLIQCDDHGDVPLSTWTLHLWKPDGFESNGSTIDALEGYPCGKTVHTVDWDKNGTVDLILGGMIKQGGVPKEPAKTFYAFSRRSDGTWESRDTKLDVSYNSGRIIFADFNGDGLSDALTDGGDGRLFTWFNTGNGFSTERKDSLVWDFIVPQTQYFHLASTLDWDMDGRSDVLIPMGDIDNPGKPRWVILRSTGGKNGYIFEQIATNIPFEAILGETVTLADPRAPRILDFDGNGSPDVALFLGNELHIFKNSAADADVLVGYSDGMNDHDPEEPGFVPNVSIAYKHLIDDSKTTGKSANEGDFYVSQLDSTNKCEYPRHCAVGSRRVVSEYALNDGQRGVRRFGLRYRDGRYDRQLQRWLGFGTRILTDLDTGASVADIYDNLTKVKIGEREVIPFVGQIVEQWHWAPALPSQPNSKQVEMSFSARTMDVVPTNGGASFFTLPTKLHTRRMQGTFSGAGTLETWVAGIAKNENATMLRDSTVNVVDFDEFRNVLEVDVATVGVDVTMHLERTVKNDITRWNLGQPDTQTECSTAAGKTSCRTITRTTNMFGEVETETTSSNDGIDDTKLTVVYDKRDKVGNVTHMFATDASGNRREATTVYDPDGVFPVSHINALGHATKTEYDNVLGVLKKVTDANGLVTQFEHDGFGRLTLEKNPDGSQTTIKRTREKIDGVSRTKERRTKTGDADDETILDSLGRPIRSFSFAPQAAGQQAKRIMQRYEYDRLSGNIAKRSVPTAEGTPDNELSFDVHEYDALEREIRHTTAWNAVTTTKYDGFLIDVTDPLLKHTITKTDTLGRPATITDAAKGTTAYTYGPFNLLATVTDPGNAVTRWTRDAFGRSTQIEEPDRGTTTLTHNGFGDLVSSTDALGRVASFDLDALGRTTTRTDKLAAQVLTTTWTWDTAPNGIGKLHTLISPDAVNTFSYTSKGQPEGMTLQVGNDSFAARQFYDEVGHVKRTVYPHPLGVEAFEVARDFDAHGYVVGVRDAATNDPYWELKSVDDAGRYKGETFGNGTRIERTYYEHKQVLKSITTTLGGSTIQQLSYDWTERLNLRQRTDALQLVNKTERFRYDELDRVTCAYFGAVESANAACATSFGYAPNGNLIDKSDVGAYSYIDPKHPHAVTNVPGVSYSYDAVGNQITRPGLVSITHTPFDLPKTITKGGQTTTFGYDGDEQRIRKTTALSDTVYVGELFEQVTSGAVKEFRYSVYSPERLITIVTRGGNEPGTRYLLTDHLGSVETVTNESGVVIEKRSNDAFGGRRNPKWGEPGGVLPSKTKRGYTGHEEEDEFGLVNMRGRMYDPKIARFTTTDPVIADVFDGQSFNAYSYVWNNPLAFTDPTGFSAEDLVWRTAITEDASGAPLGLIGWYEEAPEPEPELDPFVIPDLAANIGVYVAPVDVGTTGAGAAPPSSEGIGSFFEGLVAGSLSDNTSWSATLGSVVGGLIPGVGLVADIRDLGAAVSHVANGKEGAWLELGASIIGFVPGGDIAKGIAKGVTKGTAKATAKIGSEVVQEVAKVAKASTAKAVDDVAGLQQGAAKARKGSPRGPPKVSGAAKETGSYTTTHASGKAYHGKGARTRSQKSGRGIGKNDEHVATDWTPAQNETEAFKQEARRLRDDGGPRQPDKNYNKIESPGRKYIEHEDK